MGRHGPLVEHVPTLIQWGLARRKSVRRHECTAVMAMTMTTGWVCLVGVPLAWPCYFLMGLLFRETDRSIDDRHYYQHCK
ncbi:hypothetical protein DSI35_11330 [Mycobacterium tuberculosis]|nr:hypothetical protein DSI35_11330 [Mycobacterium tuberculosis]